MPYRTFHLASPIHAEQLHLFSAGEPCRRPMLQRQKIYQILEPKIIYEHYNEPGKKAGQLLTTPAGVLDSVTKRMCSYKMSPVSTVLLSINK